MVSEYPAAYTAANLKQLLDANDSCPSLALDEVQRLVTLAEQRASAREQLDDGQIECVIGTEWTGFTASEFGYDNGDPNQFAMGVFESTVSAGKDAGLFTDTVVVQDGWLRTGDGRRSQVAEYEDDDFDGADPGELWLPNSAQDYIAIIGLDPEIYE